jgi:hypothetical protein
MKQFLLEVAEKVKKGHPKLEDLTFVFPNRRAVLYFRKHLSALLTAPAFAPELLTIEDFIGRLSPLRVPDKLELIHRLYQSYFEVIRGVNGLAPEPFDQFYFWGEMLLRDFDELDKYMVNARQVFKDLSNQKELDASFDYLTAEQLEFLQSFWGSFDEDLSAHKKNFLHIWRQLPDVYDTFRKQLTDDGLAYEGMLHRVVAEDIGKIGPKTGNTIIFAGFNALTMVEEKIIVAMVGGGAGEVYWDIDNYYVNNNTQEAGLFFRQYQHHPVLGKTFSNDTPANFSSKKKVKIIGASQQVGQAKLMSQLLGDMIAQGMVPEDTLVVLPDEKLLLPVLHGISGSVEKLNVTMGFPLGSTPMFNLIELLAELQISIRTEKFNHRYVLAILGHPYVTAADPVAATSRRREIVEKNRVTIPSTEMMAGPPLYALLFKPTALHGVLAYLREIITSVGALPLITSLDKEYALHFLKLINRLEEVWGNDTVVATEEDPAKQMRSEWKSFVRLFRQLVRSQKIPFTGEPLKGLQVMGVLETRNLDYKNVFVLSLNEGALPASGNKSSYIPFTIRKAYGLPTAEHQDAMYAYLFYRVLQRAENVYLFYNTETDILGQGEMSRFLQQLIFESGWDIERQVLHSPIQPESIQPIEIKKDEQVLAGLVKLNEGNSRFKGISPSALNTYIDCQLKFYFQQVARIKEAREVEEDLDARVLGNLMHGVMELFYRKIQERKKSSLIEASDFSHAAVVIDQLIDSVFIATYRLDPDATVVYDGQRLVVREIIRSFVERIIKHDQAYAPFTIEGLEREGLLYYVPISHMPGQAVVGGKIDRLDKKGNVVRVIDYKTGKDKLEFESIESLFSREGTRNKAAFQTMLYALLYKSNYTEEGTRLMPGLISRMNLFDDQQEVEFTMGKVPVTDAKVLFPEFELRLKGLLEELFNPEESFKQTENRESCRYCPYKGICYR